MPTHREAIASLPPGLLQDLLADTGALVRPDELARVLERMPTVDLDHPEVIDGIATGLLATVDVASV